ncbi:integrase [Salinibacter ruber]|uniref:tyrosine-type recombinase/integrase n=1 Tax=Salinibacter ruber TaxID=146919 RepID=UPI00216A5865|nr:tyrosine-type recombinase/integrase [Salinibacter ruber]MCS3825307.1 integrase [Salinibacter ruber]
MENQKVSDDDGFHIPSKVLAADGQTVDTSGKVWELHDRSESTSKVRLNINSALKHDFDVTSERSERLIILYLYERLRSVKAWTVHGDLYAFGRFVEWWSENKKCPLEWCGVVEPDWRAFLNYCIKERSGNGNDFARLQSFYRWGTYQKNFSDFDRDIASSISVIRAPGNSKGKAVRSLDTERGPLDDTEVKLINDSLSTKKGTLKQRAIVRLLLELGLRPLALTIIRGEHLSRYDVPVAEEGEAGTSIFYQLEVPKLKGRQAKISTWYKRPLTTDLGKILEKVSRSDDNLLLHWLSEYKSPRGKIADTLEAWVREANITSPRTGQLLHLFPLRFRRTLATDMAVQGASKAQIAQALGHNDLQNVDVYMDASAVILNRMEEDDAFDFQDEVVDLFMGKVGDPDDEDVSEQRIPGAAPQVGGLKGTTGHIGACQKQSPCSLSPPLSCYTCSKFVAFEDAPHSDIADELEAWIQNSPDGVDRRVPQQHVTTLKAIRQLLQQLGDK